eukprot:TRINITY_DN9171_c0_g2_i5.p3 TRINITY_DN9171_c0_g2~~TRINITY_DN9171_c0_g2_i5.p3  ORF type:complete len:231 (+),score=80.83 TRINITY_DN9171_c0_g2_i5:987-1679(+)
MKIKVKHGKVKVEVDVPDDGSVADLKKAVQEATQIPVGNQKLVLAGKQLNDNGAGLSASGVTAKSVLMVTGSTDADALAAGIKPIITTAPVQEQQETRAVPMCEETQHAKVLASGPLETSDFDPTLTEQRPLPVDESTREPFLRDLMNAAKQRVRMRVLSRDQVLVFASESDMRRFPFGNITKITTEPITDHPTYNILVLHLGDSAFSRFYIYWYPVQFVQNLKNIIFGF